MMGQFNYPNMWNEKKLNLLLNIRKKINMWRIGDDSKSYLYEKKGRGLLPRYFIHWLNMMGKLLN